METFAEPQQRVITEYTQTSNVNLVKEWNIRLLQLCLGIGIVLLAVGLVLLTQ